MAISSSASATHASSVVVKDGVPTQRFMKDVLRVGRFTKREKGTGRVIFSEDFTAERLKNLASTFHAMKDNGVKVKLLNDKKEPVADAPHAPLTKNHAGVFERDHTKRLPKLVENTVAPTVDMFVQGDRLFTIHEVKGQDAIDLVTRNGDVSVEIDPCFIDSTDKRYGEAITAVSLVVNPLVPGQRPFEPVPERIAASADEGERLILSFDDGEPPMKLAAILAAVAGLAGVSATQVTEDNAIDTINGVKTKLTDTEAKLTKALSSDEPNPAMNSARKMAARGIEKELGRLKDAGILSDAGVNAMIPFFAGDRTKSEFSTFVLSHDEPDDAVSAVEKLVDLIIKNPGVKKGPQTGLQTTVALSRDGEGNANQQMTPERVRELLNMTATGRELVAAAAAK